MKTPLSTALSLALFAASLGGLASLPGTAHAGTNAITVSDVMYSRDEKLNFKVQAYLAKRSPRLNGQIEIITHWAGYTGISPKVLIALMEQESGIVTQPRPSQDAMLRPFGNLSPKIGFNQQVRDVAQRLREIVYSQRAEAFSGKSDFVPVDPIQALYAQSSGSQAKATSLGVTRFASTYAGLFQEIWGSAVKPDVLSQITIQAIPSTTLLALPYPTGQDWYIGGPHSYTGSNSPMSSLDMSPRSSATTANKQIRASTGGTVIKYSRCQLEVVHSSGWSTNYYHLSSIQVDDGATVTKGQYIALPASTESQALCDGGSWTGPHVHWTLYNTNGIENSLNGVTVSNYLMTITGTSAYGTNCSKNYLTRNGTNYCFGTRIVK
jgi:hypothetical protein